MWLRVLRRRFVSASLAKHKIERTRRKVRLLRLRRRRMPHRPDSGFLELPKNRRARGAEQSGQKTQRRKTLEAGGSRPARCARLRAVPEGSRPRLTAGVDTRIRDLIVRERHSPFAAIKRLRARGDRPRVEIPICRRRRRCAILEPIKMIWGHMDSWTH